MVPFGAELTAGLLHLWRSPLLRRLSLTTIVFSVAIGMVEPTVYGLVGDGLHRPPEFVGVLVSVQGAGAILGGVVVSGAIRRISEPSLIVVGLLVVAAGAGLCAIPALPAALLGFGLVGVGIPTLGVAIATLLQRCTPNAVMGRVAAGYDMIGTVPTTASIAVGAILVGVWPFQVILGITAVGCVAAALSMLPARGLLTDAVAPAAMSPVVPAPSDPGQHRTPPTSWISDGWSEQQKREGDGEHHFGQRDERGDRAAQPADGHDAGQIGEHSADQDQSEHRQPPRHASPAGDGADPPGRERHEADDAGQRHGEAPTPVPTVVSSSGWMVALSLFSASTKYADRPSAAPRAHAMPTGLMVKPLVRSSTSASPAMDRPAPASTGRRSAPAAAPSANR